MKKGYLCSDKIQKRMKSKKYTTTNQISRPSQQQLAAASVSYHILDALFDGDSGWCAYAHHGNSRTQQWHTVCHIGSDVVDDSGAVCFVYDASYVVEDSYIHVWIVDTADRQCSHCVYGY